MTLIYLAKEHCIGMDRLFLQKSYHPMAEAWRAKIGEEIEVEKHSLSCSDHRLEESSWLFKLEENEQMRPLIFGLLKEVMH